MPTYTVHQPPQREGRPVPGPERFAFVRDGFHVWAFLLPPLWMLLHRMWLVLIGYIVVVIAMTVGFAVADVPQWADAVANLLLGILIGLEAASLRRWTLRKWTQLGYVVAEDEELAERRFFAQWVEGVARAVPPPPSAPPPSIPKPPPVVSAPLPQRATPDVIGLFPQPGLPR